MDSHDTLSLGIDAFSKLSLDTDIEPTKIQVGQNLGTVWHI